MQKITPIVIAGIFSATSLTVLANQQVDFDQHDQDRDGYLTESEWRGIQDVNVSFTEADSDGDGQLSEAEVEAATQTGAELDYQQTGDQSRDTGMQDTQSADPEVQETGDEYDTQPIYDETGTQDTQATDPEVQQSGEEYDTQPTYDQTGMEETQSDPEVRQTGVETGSVDSQQQSGEYPKMSDAAFEEIDANGDGRISRDEAEQAGDQYVRSSFDGLDQDGDGEIARDEVIKQ